MICKRTESYTDLSDVLLAYFTGKGSSVFSIPYIQEHGKTTDMSFQIFFY